MSSLYLVDNPAGLVNLGSIMKVFLLAICLNLAGCVVLPTLNHPRSSYPEHDFTKPPPEIPEQYWGTIDTTRL